MLPIYLILTGAMTLGGLGSIVGLILTAINYTAAKEAAAEKYAILTGDVTYMFFPEGLDVALLVIAFIIAAIILLISIALFGTGIKEGTDDAGPAGPAVSGGLAAVGAILCLITAFNYLGTDVVNGVGGTAGYFTWTTCMFVVGASCAVSAISGFIHMGIAAAGAYY